MKLLGSLFIGLALLIYALYCFQHGGSHQKRRGWVPKEESPKIHMFQMVLYILIGLGQITFFALVNLELIDL